MRLIKNTTELIGIGIKNQNIIISLVFETDTHNDKLPAVMSWDEFGFKKGELAFVAQKYETNELIIILDNRRQTTIRNYFLKYPLKVRQQVQFITMD
ncbi:transposase, partial [Streptococcus thermophilus]